MSETKLLAIIREDPMSPKHAIAVTKLDLGGQSFREVNQAIGIFSSTCVLNLARNKLTSIGQHLSTLPCLSSLDLSHNAIESLDGLQDLKQLRSLDLSHNVLENFLSLGPVATGGGAGGAFPRLEILNVSHNKLAGSSSLSPLLVLCKDLIELDVSFNLLDCDVVDSVLSKMDLLKTLYLSNNAILTPYRKLVLSKCTSLTSLDHHPVFPQERLRSNLTSDAAVEQPAVVSAWQGQGYDHATSNPDDDSQIALGILHPVLQMLSSSELVVASLVCKWWRDSAKDVLKLRRLQKAQSRLEEAKERWEEVRGSIANVSKSEFVEVLGIYRPPTCLLQCCWSLQLLVEMLDERKMKCMDFSAESLEALNGLDSLSLSEDSKAPQRREEGQVSDAVGGEREGSAEGADGDAEGEREEFLLDFGSDTWCGESWRKCLRSISKSQEAYISSLQEAATELLDHIPTRRSWQEVLVRLRARTGSSDELEVYIPQLRSSDVKIYSRVFGHLCDWLLGLEGLAFAALRLHQAKP